MATVLHPWQILVAAMADGFTRQQDAVIEYLLWENRVLKAIERRLSLELSIHPQVNARGKYSVGVPVMSI